MTREMVCRLSCWLGLSFGAFGASACDSELVTLGRLPNDPGSGSGTGGSSSFGTGGGSGSSTGGSSSGAGGDSSSGAGGMSTLSFGEPRRLVELGSEKKDDNATLTGSMLEVYFTSTRVSGQDVYYAKRSSVDEPFETPELFEPASSSKDDTSPAISLDGKTLWVAQKRDMEGLGEFDIWVTTNDGAGWSELSNVTELNSAQKDIPRPPAGDNRVMPLGSQRSEDDYRTFLATRPDESSPFGDPVPLPELENGKRIVDGFLTEDLLMLFYSSGDGEDEGDLWVARRSSPDAAFGPPEPLSELNTAEWDERDPWVAPDLSRIFFTSNRVDENHEIFEATITLR